MIQTNLFKSLLFKRRVIKFTPPPQASSIIENRPPGSIKLHTAFETYNFPDGSSTPSQVVQTSRAELLKLFENMWSVRRMEMAADALYKAKLIRGFCHLGIGQEAIPVGMEAALDKEDALITAYRCHGFALMRGGTVHSILAELLGKSTGISRGKGGSMHMFANQFYGGNGIVGAQVPVGAGVAFTQKYLNKQNCTFALYGDGAANQGQIFEVYNMAAIMKLPIVFVCENNRYAMGTSIERSSASQDYFKRGGDYVPGLRVDGLDVLAVKEASKFAKDFVLKNGPLVMEMITYRYQGHSMSDPGTTYRTREEIQEIRNTRDTIRLVQTQLIENEWASPSELKEIEMRVKQEVDSAVTKAKADPIPEMTELTTNIYSSESDPNLAAFRTWSMFSTAMTTLLIVAYFSVTGVYNWRRQYSQSTKVQEAEQAEIVSENELQWRELQEARHQKPVRTFSRLENGNDISRFLESVKVFEYLEKVSLGLVLKGGAELREVEKNELIRLDRTNLAFVTFGTIKATYADPKSKANGLTVTCTPGKTITSYSSVMRALAKYYNRTSNLVHLDESCVDLVAQEDSQILILPESCFVNLAENSKLSVAHLTQVILSRFKRATMPILFDYFNLTGLASSFLSYFIKKSHGSSDVKLTDLLNACQESFKEDRLLRVIFQYLIGTFDLDHTSFTAVEASLALLQSHIQVKSTASIGEIVQQVGEECRGAFLVLEGNLGFSFTKESQGIVGSVGDFVGVISALMGKCSSIQVTSRSSSVTYAIISQHLIEMISERDPKILFANIPDNRSTSQFIEFVDMSIDWQQCSCGAQVQTEANDTQFVVKVLHGRVREITSDDDFKQGEFGSGSFLGEHGIFSKKTGDPIKFVTVRQTEITAFPVDLVEGLITLNSHVATSILPKLLSRPGLSDLSIDPIRTICILPIGVDRISPSVPSSLHLATANSMRDKQVRLAEEVSEGLQEALQRHSTTFTVIDNARATELMGRQLFTTLGTLKMNEFLSSQEDVSKIIIYVADGIFSNWTRQCISQADLVLLIGDLEDEVVLFGDLEWQMLQMNPLISTELCLISAKNSKSRTESRKWLKNRPWIKTHHHLNTTAHGSHYETTTHWENNGLPLDLIDNLLRKSRDFQSYLMKRSGAGMVRGKRRRSSLAFLNNNDENNNNCEDTNESFGYGRLGRRILGRSIGLVLGGGGARGLAHLGIIRAMKEAGIQIDLIGGTSIGAFIGGLLAREEGHHHGSAAALNKILKSIEDFSVAMNSKWRQALDLTYPATAWFTGHAFNRALWKHFGFSGIEDFMIPFFAVTTDLTRSRLQVHRSGPAWKYVRASMSLSGFLPPVCDSRDGTLLVDGGYLANVPIEQMQRGSITELSDLVIKNDGGDRRNALSAAVVIAVDVGRTSDRIPIYYGDSLNGWRVLYEKFLQLIMKNRSQGSGSKSTTITNTPLTLDEIQFRLAYASSAGLLSRTLKRSHVELAEELGSKPIPYVTVKKDQDVSESKDGKIKKKSPQIINEEIISDSSPLPEVIYMRPSGIQQYGTLEFQKWKEIVDIGYKYGQELIEEWRAAGLIDKILHFQGGNCQRTAERKPHHHQQEVVLNGRRPRRSSI